MSISDVMKILAPQDADQLEDLILALACKEMTEEREMLMDAACLRYSKLVNFERFRSTMIVVNECVGD